MRVNGLILAGILVVCLLTPTPTGASRAKAAIDVLRGAAGWLTSTITGIGAGEVLARLRDNSTQGRLQKEIEGLEAQLGLLTEDMIFSTGRNRGDLEKLTNSVEEELRIFEEVQLLVGAGLDEIEAKLSSLRTEQARLSARIDELEQRVKVLETRVDDIDHRVEILEDAFIGECLDRRDAPLRGYESFRIDEDPSSRLDDDFRGQFMTLRASIFLNACTSDLRFRGILVQVSVITRDLFDDIVLYANVNHIESSGFDPLYGSQLTRYEFDFGRPSYRVDAKVQEFFIPYSEVPFPRTNRFALSLVLTHDGGAVYSLPDRAIQCNLGQRVQCRWR